MVLTRAKTASSEVAAGGIRPLKPAVRVVSASQEIFQQRMSDFGSFAAAETPVLGNKLLFAPLRQNVQGADFIVSSAPSSSVKN